MPEKMDNELGGLKDRLKDFNVEPSEGIWTSLEEKLAQKRKRRPIAIWWFVGAAIFLGLLIGTPLVVENFKKEIHPDESTANQNHEIENSQNPPKNRVSQLEKASPKSNSESQENPESVYQKLPENPNSTPSENEPDDQNSGNENRNPSKVQGVHSGKVMIATVREKESKSKNSDGIKRDKSRIKVGEFTSKLVATLPELNKGRNEKPISEKPEQSEIAEAQNLNESQNISPTIKSENSALTFKEPKSEKEKTEITQNQAPQGLPKTGVSDSIIASKKQDSTAVLEPTALKSPIDSSQKQESLKWKRSFWLAPKFAALRSISINQNPAEKRISLPENNTQWTNRMALDLGFRMERNLNPVLAFIGFGGFSFLQEQVKFNQDLAITGYELTAENGTLTVNPKMENQTGLIQSQLFAGFAGVGLGISSSKFTTFRLSAGAQFRISETIKKELGGKSQTNRKSASLNEPVFFIQASASRIVPIGKFQFMLEPMVQFYSSPVFQLQPGTSSRPVYLGMQVHFVW